MLELHQLEVKSLSVDPLLGFPKLGGCQLSDGVLPRWVCALHLRNDRGVPVIAHSVGLELFTRLAVLGSGQEVGCPADGGLILVVLQSLVYRADEQRCDNVSFVVCNEPGSVSCIVLVEAALDDRHQAGCFCAFVRGGVL